MTSDINPTRAVALALGAFALIGVLIVSSGDLGTPAEEAAQPAEPAPPVAPVPETPPKPAATQSTPEEFASWVDSPADAGEPAPEADDGAAMAAPAEQPE